MVDIDATSPQLQVVKALFEAYCTFDIDNVLPLLSKDYKFQTFPKIADHPDEERDRHLKKYGKILSLLIDIDTVVHEVIEAPGKVVTHITFKCTTADATRLDYDSVVINTIVKEDGKLKILENKDFSDPRKREELHKWINKALGGPIL